MKVSVVTTTKSSRENVDRLITSINKIKNSIHEFILVDAGTPDIWDVMSEDYHIPTIVDGAGSSRGGGKNIGIKKASGDVVAFLDDDTEVDVGWVDEIKRSMKSYSVVAGFSPNPVGRSLGRVSVFVDGQDVTWPTCNIAYKKSLFDELGLFDEGLVTGEDIDFNIRCVKAGYVIGYNPRMIVFHYHRSSFRGFARQAFWNGYGRRQLNLKYPDLRHMHQHGLRFRNICRLGFGALGYLTGGVVR